MSHRAYIAYSFYYATGEGVTVFIALGGSPEHTEQLFRARVPEYFQAGMKLCPLDNAAEDVVRIKAMVAGSVLELFERHPPGTTEYFSHLHYNFA